MRATCPACGDVQLPVGQVKVWRRAEDGSGSYELTCPLCDLVVVKDADPRTIDLLVGSGAELVYSTQDGTPIALQRSRPTDRGARHRRPGDGPGPSRPTRPPGTKRRGHH